MAQRIAYKELCETAVKAAARMQRTRQPPKAQLRVFKYYDHDLSRAAKPTVMTLWELNFLMRVTVGGEALRYNLFVSTKGELVGYVTHIAPAAVRGRHSFNVLAVLLAEHFYQLEDEDKNRLLMELQALAGVLGAPV